MSRFRFISPQNPEMQKFVELDHNFWDCSCESNYIHPIGETGCDKCGASVQTSPSSRASEVKEYKMDLIAGVKE